MSDKEHYQYHLTHNGPTLPHWPNGSWAVYRITGDEIAQRTICDETGKVVRRHSWCGYVGMAEDLAGVQRLIESDRKA